MINGPTIISYFGATQLRSGLSLPGTQRELELVTTPECEIFLKKDPFLSLLTVLASPPIMVNQGCIPCG